MALVTLSLLMARPVRAADEAKPDEIPPAAQTAKFSPAQIEQLVVPIALYPDGLAVQVLIAATYPLEIVEAARWRAKNASLQGDALDKALETQKWDPSVESLTHFPDLLKRMSDNLDWTKDLGDAFLDQKDEVLDGVQRMRAKAYDAGTLKTTKEQTVTREIVKEKEIIRVEPADPQVVYVPQYSPTAAYGPTYAAPPAPYYPAMYPPYDPTMTLLTFGAGMAVGAAISGGCDWDDHNVYNNNYGGGGGGGGNNNVNVNKNVDRSRTKVEGGGRQKWQHNPEHRGGVGYRDQASAKKYGGRDRVAARDRANQDVSRGYGRGQEGGGRPSQQPAGGRSPQQGGSRPGTGPGQGGGGRQASAGEPGGRGGQRPGGSPSQQPATRPGGGGSRPDTRGGGAFGGYESGRSAQNASTRGAASRGSPSYAGGGSGQRGGGGFGGGGGGGRGRGGGGGGGGRGGGGGGRGGGGGGGRGGGGGGGRGGGRR